MTQGNTVRSRRRWLTGSALALLGLALAGPLHAEAAWPTKPIRIIVPYNAGGATDIVARMVAERLSNRLGQPVLVENRGGASGIMGTDAAAKAAPDGYTLTVSLSSSLMQNQFLYHHLPYQTLRDFVLISQIAIAPVTLVAHPSVPAKDGPALLAYVRAHPGKVAYGSWGVGSYGHLGLAYLDASQHGDMTHVAYKGESAMLQDLIGGRIQLAFASALGTKPYIDNGRLKLIGVTGDKRMDVLPDAPTLAEQGLREDAYRLVGWVALAAPKDTPAPIVARLAGEIHDMVRTPQVQARLIDMGFIPTGNSPTEFVANYQQELPVWKTLVEQSGARLD